MSVDTTSKKFWQALFLFFIVQVLAWYVGSASLFDSSDYIVRILAYKKILYHDDLRDIGFFLLHLPSYLYVNYIGENLKTVSNIFQLTHLLIPLVPIVIHYFVLKKEEKKWALWHVYIVLISNIFSYYCHVSELNVATAFLFPVVSLSLCNLSLSRIVFITFFYVISNGSYPVALIVSPFLCLRIILKFRESKFTKKEIYLFIMYLLGIVFQIYALSVYKAEYSEGYSNFFNESISNFYYTSYFHYMIASFFLILATLKWDKLNKLVIALSLFGLSYSILFLKDLHPWMHYTGRSLTSFIFGGILAYIVVTHELIKKFGPFFYQKYELFFERSLEKVFVWCLILSCVFSLHFINMRKGIENDLYDQPSEVVYFDDFSKINDDIRHTASDHTISMMLLLWSLDQPVVERVLVESDSISSYPKRVGFKGLIHFFNKKGVNFTKAVLESENYPPRSSLEN